MLKYYCVKKKSVMEKILDCQHTLLYSSSVFSQKKLQETSLKSVQKLKDAEKELRYAIKYIKVSASNFLLYEK